MSDFKLFPGINFADSLSRVTGMSFENAMHELNRIDSPSVSDGLENADRTPACIVYQDAVCFTYFSS